MTGPQTHALYRFFGAGGTLLYIGITNELPRRLRQHNDDKAWWLGVARIEVEHYPSRDAVLRAEKRAIVAERPLYNEQHNGPDRVASLSSPPSPSPLSGVLQPICMGCENTIETWEGGLIHVSWSEVNAVEQELANWRARTIGRDFLDRSDLDSIPDLVRWRVHCRDCNPHHNEESATYCDGCYAFEVNACRTWRQLVEWTAHLAEKNWLQATDWFEFIGGIARGTLIVGLVAESDLRAVI